MGFVGLGEADRVGSGTAIIYSIVIHRWGDLFLYSLIFAGIMAILMAVVVVQDFCDAMLDKISML